MVLQGNIEIKYNKIKHQVTNIFMKRLNSLKFKEFRKQLGMMTRSAMRENNHCGGVLRN